MGNINIKEKDINDIRRAIYYKTYVITKVLFKCKDPNVCNKNFISYITDCDEIPKDKQRYDDGYNLIKEYGGMDKWDYEVIERKPYIKEEYEKLIYQLNNVRGSIYQ